MNENKLLIENLVNKSIEAFILGIEIYNKPTVKYRIEGFSFFICNAWELMLKAHLLNLNKNIYYDDNKRTFDLSKVIKAIYTDVKQPLRINLEKIIELRNTSTHFITEEYEYIYIPLFISCVDNFCTQIKRFHNEDMVNYIPANFLTLPIGIETSNTVEIKGKYTNEMADKLIQTQTEIDRLKNDINSDSFAVQINHRFYLEKDKNKADFTYSIDKAASEKVKIITKELDPANKYVLTSKKIIKKICKEIKNNNIEFNYISTTGDNSFNMHTFQKIINFYNLKTNKLYCYKFEGLYRYSPEIIKFIIDTIKSDPDIIENIVITNKKKITPGS